MFCDECEPVYMYVMQLEACSTERGLASVRPKIPLSYICNIPATQISAHYTECVLNNVPVKLMYQRHLEIDCYWCMYML